MSTKDVKVKILLSGTAPSYIIGFATIPTEQTFEESLCEEYVPFLPFKVIGYADKASPYRHSTVDANHPSFIRKSTINLFTIME